jgi:hypothetical protein
MYELYPKSFLRANLQPKRNRCFVLMPFASSFNEVYAEIKTSLKDIGFQCSRADDIYENRPIMSIIMTEIATAHFVIADLTGKNPNVFYEVGIAHSFRDISNVILLAQHIDFVPFDLRHLPVILYQPDNLRGLAAKLPRMVLDNKDFFEGHIRLRERYGQQFTGEGSVDEVIDFLESRDRGYWRLVLETLGVSEGAMPEADVVVNVFRLRGELGRLAASGSTRLFRNLFKVFRDSVVRFVEIDQIKLYAEEVLAQGRFLEFPLEDAEMSGIAIDFALSLLQSPRCKRPALDWVFRYLSRPKVGGIDLNRSKIEQYFLRSDDPDILEALIYSLEGDNSYMRETAADFIGEMRIHAAAARLLTALPNETSVYAARSMISALGKLTSREGGEAILAWVGQNARLVQERKADFIATFSNQALAAIDRKHGTRYLERLQAVLPPL